jgi:hypothetical protein
VPKAVSVRPKKREYAKSAVRLIGRPEKGKHTREFIVVPNGREKAKVRRLRA